MWVIQVVIYHFAHPFACGICRAGVANPIPSAISLDEARKFLGQLPQGAALIDPDPSRCLCANAPFQSTFGLDGPEGPLPEGLQPRLPGLRRYPTSSGERLVRVSAFPLVEHPGALLLQESQPGLETALSEAVQWAFPIGVAWIDLVTDRIVLINQPFWSAWRLPLARQPDRGSALRATCRGHALQTDSLDEAWPSTGAAPGRFADVPLTDGRALRLAAFDPPNSERRWVLVEDVTEPRQERIALRQDELRAQESQRLESLSVLAGGIAHDFNNLLLVILTNADLLRDHTELDADIQLAVADIRVAAERASDLSAKMLAYSGRGHMAHIRTDICEVVDGVIAELPSYGGPIPERARPGEPLVVIGDPDQLRQLFKAILLNAQESVGVSAIRIACQRRFWSPEALSALNLGDQLVSGTFVTVTVTDDGQGVDDLVLPRVFDPFFSTRGPSRGLGLAAAVGIARGHGGTVHLDSERGRGATVTVVLPAVQAHGRPTSSTSGPRSAVETGTVLLVDDESLVRRSARQALEQAGFRVLEAENGAQALELFAASPDRFDLIIMDISMPGPPGDLVAREMRSLTDRPVPLVLSSGYRPRVELGETGVADRFLQKPYRRSELVQTARELLGLEER